MPKNKSKIRRRNIQLAIIKLLITTILVSAATIVLASGKDEIRQTIPTRTPVPPPTQPPSDDDDGGGSSQPPPPPPTNGPPPTNTPVSVDIVPTPLGADDCGGPSFQASAGAVNVRQGPGTDYAPVDQLVFLEVRDIVGRAEFAEWWAIRKPDGSQGWIANEVGTVFGYTGNVPILEPPVLNGVTPTPGASWLPTPNPVCPTPTPSPIPTATPSQVPSTPAPSAGAGTRSESPTVIAAAVTVDPSPTLVPPTEIPTQTPPPAPTDVISTSSLPTATLQPIDSADNSGGPNWLLVGGFGLIILAIVSLVLSRRGTAV